MPGCAWTEAEKALIARVLAEGRDLKIEEIATLFPGRTKGAVKARLCGRRGFSARRNWSDQEIETLLANSSKTLDELRLLLPGRTSSAIHFRLRSTGIVAASYKAKSSKKSWSGAEDDHLKSIWVSSETAGRVAAALTTKFGHKRTAHAVRVRARLLALQMGTSAGLIPFFQVSIPGVSYRAAQLYARTHGWLCRPDGKPHGRTFITPANLEKLRTAYANTVALEGKSDWITLRKAAKRLSLSPERLAMIHEGESLKTMRLRSGALMFFGPSVEEVARARHKIEALMHHGKLLRVEEVATRAGIGNKAIRDAVNSSELASIRFRLPNRASYPVILVALEDARTWALEKRGYWDDRS